MRLEEAFVLRARFLPGGRRAEGKPLGPRVTAGAPGRDRRAGLPPRSPRRHQGTSWAPSLPRLTAESLPWARGRRGAGAPWGHIRRPRPSSPCTCGRRPPHGTRAGRAPLAGTGGGGRDWVEISSDRNRTSLASVVRGAGWGTDPRGRTSHKYTHRGGRGFLLPGAGGFPRGRSRRPGSGNDDNREVSESGPRSTCSPHVSHRLLGGRATGQKFPEAESRAVRQRCRGPTCLLQVRVGAGHRRGAGPGPGGFLLSSRRQRGTATTLRPDPSPVPRRSPLIYPLVHGCGSS